MLYAQHQEARLPGRGVHAELPCRGSKTCASEVCDAAARPRCRHRCSLLATGSSRAAGFHVRRLRIREKAVRVQRLRRSSSSEHLRLNQDSALYQLEFYNDAARTLDQTALTLRPEGRAALRRAHAERARPSRGQLGHPAVRPRIPLRRTLRARTSPIRDSRSMRARSRCSWGKGYAWNPVGFRRTPEGPERPGTGARGFHDADRDHVRNFDGALRTVAFTPPCCCRSPPSSTATSAAPGTSTPPPSSTCSTTTPTSTS